MSEYREIGVTGAGGVRMVGRVANPTREELSLARTAMRLAAQRVEKEGDGSKVSQAMLQVAAWIEDKFLDPEDR